MKKTVQNSFRLILCNCVLKVECVFKFEFINEIRSQGLVIAAAFTVQTTVFKRR